MNNRVGMAVVGVIAAVAIIFAVVQSGNLTQTETKLSAAQSTATGQQVAFANQGTAAAGTLSAASTSAADTANAAATAQANAAATAQAKALADAQSAAATEQAKALADAAKVASTMQAQGIAAANQAAATAQAQALASANNAAATAQASAVSANQNAAATSQASAVAAAQAQATATLAAVVDAAAQAQADAVKDVRNAAATAQAKTVATLQAQATATLGAVYAQASADASDMAQAYSATQKALTTQIAEANDALATAQAAPAGSNANPIEPTAVPTNEAGAVPKDWKRYVGKGVAIQLPNTYVGSELGSDPKTLAKMLRNLGPDFAAAATLLEQNPDILAFIAVNPGGNGVAPSSVIVVSIPMPVNFSLNTLLEATVNQLPKGSRIIERSIVQIGDYEAGRMIVQTKVGSIVSEQLQYYIIQNNTVYLIGFTGAPDTFDSQVDSFEQSMQTFEILSKPGI